MPLHISFFVAMLICLVAVFFSFREKRMNIGFVVTAILLIVCDMLCILLNECESIRQARVILYIYYIAYSWMFFSSLWTVLGMASSARYNTRLLPMLGISVAQTVIIVVIFSSTQIVAFSKKILAGRVWWIAEPASEYKGLWGLNTFSTICCLSSATSTSFWTSRRSRLGSTSASALWCPPGSRDF